VFGTLVGAVIIGIIEAGIISAGLSGFWTRLVHGLIIVVSVSVYATAFKTGR
jgi:simple sugar transport system permease protein